MTTFSPRRRLPPIPGRVSIWSGAFIRCRILFPNKCTDMTDVADYLGKKCGGWSASGETYGKLDGKWIGVPVAATGALVNYRVSAAEKAGHKEFPEGSGRLPRPVKGLKKNNTPAGMALGHASGDANTWLHWALWAHGGNLVDKDNKVVINSPETAKALEYVKGLYDNFIPGTASWNDSRTTRRSWPTSSSSPSMASRSTSPRRRRTRRSPRT